MDSGLARSLSSGAHSRDPLARPGMTKKRLPLLASIPLNPFLSRRDQGQEFLDRQKQK